MTTQYLEQQRLGSPAPATEVESHGSVNVRSRIAGFVAIVQVILLLAHWFVYQTWMSFRGDPDPPGATVLQVVLLLLSVTFFGAAAVQDRGHLVGVFQFFLSRSVHVLGALLGIPAAWPSTQ